MHDFVYLGRSRLLRSRANLIQTLNTVAALGQQGRQVELWLPSWPAEVNLQERLKKYGIDASLPLRGSFWLHPRWHYWPFVLLKGRLLRSARVVYTRVPEISQVLSICGIPHHLEIHHVEKLAQRGLLPQLLRRHREGVLRTLLPISQSGAAYLIDRGALPSRVHVAPSGVNIDAFAAVRPLDPDHLARPRIVHLGRLSGERGLEIFKFIAAQNVCDMTIVGGDESVPGAENIAPVPLSQVPLWYDQADCVLLPYQPEIPTIATMSPIKLFEALAAGRPIIASDLPTIREVLEHEKTGLLVPPRDCAAWLAAIQRLQRDRGLAVRLAEEAKRLSRFYSWEMRAKRICAAVDSSFLSKVWPPSNGTVQ